MSVTQNIQKPINKTICCSRPIMDRTPIARGRCKRSPAHVQKYILARLSIPFPPDRPKSRGSIQWSLNTLQRRDTASTLKQQMSQLISRVQFELITILGLVVNNPTSYLGGQGFIYWPTDWLCSGLYSFPNIW
jgi:hypothetical protein